ncbi:MAG: alpha/beta hydrolase [Magnetospirillum sp.]|nr:alpha/beta hydrolase [Magnetospirillum sp.]
MTPGHHEFLIGPLGLRGTLRLPMRPRGLVVFAHGSGSSRFSPRNVHVAEILGGHRLATLLFDLLTPEEAASRANVFDIPLLAERLAQAVARVDEEDSLKPLPLGLFGASTGAAAALVASTRLGARVACVVSRGGRPDLAGEALPLVTAPTLLIVGSHDFDVLELNRRAMRHLGGPSSLEIVPGASHLFEEAGTLDVAAAHAAAWFVKWMGG